MMQTKRHSRYAPGGSKFIGVLQRRDLRMHDRIFFFKRNNFMAKEAAMVSADDTFEGPPS